MGTRVLCWACEDASQVTRLSGLTDRIEHADVDLLSPQLAAPSAYRHLDMLRIDHVPAGQSCRVLSQLLRGGVRPSLVVMLVLSQVPPPFRFAPLSLDIRHHPAALVSCSLSLAASLLEPYGITLLRLTGPYALFVKRDLWQGPLPLDELACYRGASVWGYEDLPLAFVREWTFVPVDEGLSRIWSNMTELYKAAGQVNAPFTLAVA